MTHVVHPYAHRLGIIRDWKSRWFAGSSDYASHLKADILIRRFLDRKLRGNYVATVDIERTAKQYRIGIISNGGNPRSATFYMAFEERLRELGWVDGKNLAIDFESGDSSSQLSTIASRMVQRRVDAIVVVGPEAALKAASDATRIIPIVSIALNYDPVEKGYVSSLARPGRNITGVFFRNPEIGPKQLEFLLLAMPRGIA